MSMEAENAEYTRKHCGAESNQLTANLTTDVHPDEPVITTSLLKD